MRFWVGLHRLPPNAVLGAATTWDVTAPVVAFSVGAAKVQVVSTGALAPGL